MIVIKKVILEMSYFRICIADEYYFFSKDFTWLLHSPDEFCHLQTYGLPGSGPLYVHQWHLKVNGRIAW